MHRTGPPRAQGLFLCLTLLLGGFGLPLLDAARFHSTPAASAQRAGTGLQGQHGTGVSHVLGCAVLMSAASERGLPSVGAPTLDEVRVSGGASLTSRQTLIPTSDATLSLPRAPPSV